MSHPVYALEWMWPVVRFSLLLPGRTNKLYETLVRIASAVARLQQSTVPPYYICCLVCWTVWKEVVIIYKVLSQHLTGGPKKASLWAENQIQGLPNIQHK
jgi:hypothetical protein